LLAGYTCPHCGTKYVIKPAICNLCKQSTGVLEYIAEISKNRAAQKREEMQESMLTSNPQFAMHPTKYD